MATSDVRHTLSTENATRTVDVAYLPSVYLRGGDPLRALAFWVGKHPYQAVEDDSAALRAERIRALAELAPKLPSLAKDRRPAVRMAVATCFSIMARGGQAPTDREVWRTLLGLARYDDDPEVRAVAERAIDDLEHCGTVARAS